jgi:uncharacterized protein YcbX
VVRVIVSQDLSRGRIAALCIYPVKSGRGIAVGEAGLGALGLAEDRRWMIVDAASGRFLTQRVLPQLATLRPRLDAEGLVLELPTGTTLTVDRSDRGAPRQVEVWGDTVAAVEPDPQASDALARWLGRPVALVRCPAGAERPCDPEVSAADSRVAFADGFPLLVTSTSSLDVLNEAIGRRGGAPVPMQRFRPNIVLEGVDAGVEDRASAVILDGGLRLDLVKRCERCAVTTIDQSSGARMGKEPLRTLAAIRTDKASGGVWFGQNAIPRLATGAEAVIAVGQGCTLRS